MKTITVFLADDHAIFRAGLRLLLEAEDDMEVVGEVENGSDAVVEAIRLHPDVILLDLAMPLLNGMEAARRLAREVPNTRVIILSGYSDDQRVRQAIDAGVDGFLMKETASDLLLHAIREVDKGNTFFSPFIAKRLLKHWQNRSLQSDAVFRALTRRQTEVLQLIAEGFSSKQIAGRFSVSSKTIEKHRQALMDKLDIHEIASLTRYAVAVGIVDLNQVPGLAIPNHRPPQKAATTHITHFKNNVPAVAAKTRVEDSVIYAPFGADRNMGEIPHGHSRRSQ
ncbi:MAG TPA: response regulator transcription factor [Candidatus Paceibacterota bacterium]|nr:response regulator transcription factor [Candidatus Paceibacterota bacterium]